MRPVRFVALSEDGHSLVLTDEVGRLLALPIDERVQYAVRPDREAKSGHIPVPVPLENTTPTLSPRDIQARIRSGESADGVARIAGVPVDRVLRYAGPVLQERAMLAQHARRTKLRGSERGSTLAEVVDTRLLQHGIDTEKISWDAARKEDGTWRIFASWPSGKATAQAVWELDKARQLVTPFDDMAQYLCADRTSVHQQEPIERHTRGHGLATPQHGDPSRGDLGRGDLGRGDLGRGDLGRGELGRGELSRGGHEPMRPQADPPRREKAPARPADDPIRSGRDALLASLDRPLGTPRTDQAASAGTGPATKPAEPTRGGRAGRGAGGRGAAALIGGNTAAGSAFDEPAEPAPKEVPSVPSLAVLRPRRTGQAPEEGERPRKRLPSWDDVLFGGGSARESG